MTSGQAERPSRWCVTSGGDEIRRRSYVNHFIWCAENGVDHRLGLGLRPGVRTVFDYKYGVIRRALRDYAWVLWVDDDVYFTRWSAQGVEQLMDQAERADGFAVFAEGVTEPNGLWSHINSGVMLLRRDPRTLELLDRAEAIDLDRLAGTWDFEADGLFSHGDQDALWAALKHDDALRGGTRIVPHADLNSRPHLVDVDPAEVLTVHFCGDNKDARIHAFARRFGWGLELVPTELLDRYSVRVRERSSAPRFAALRLRRGAYHLRRRVRAKVAFVREERRWR